VQGRLAALAAERDTLSDSLQVLSTEKAELQRGKQEAERQLAALQQRLQTQETQFAAQMAAKEEEARRAAQQAAAAAAAAPAARAPLAPAAAPMHHDADMGAADGEEFEDAENLPNINKMTISQMKDWLMEHGHEADVWALVQKKGKKADFEQLMRRVTGQ
jgi:septal ring factor EnvC (AmiA/AmiB activator)